MAKQFIHEKSNIEGDVVLGENASVWAFASIKGDEAKLLSVTIPMCKRRDSPWRG
jgi:hypothetical protein